MWKFLHSLKIVTTFLLAISYPQSSKFLRAIRIELYATPRGYSFVQLKLNNYSSFLDLFCAWCILLLKLTSLPKTNMAMA